MTEKDKETKRIRMFAGICFVILLIQVIIIRDVNILSFLLLLVGCVSFIAYIFRTEVDVVKVKK